MFQLTGIKGKPKVICTDRSNGTWKATLGRGATSLMRPNVRESDLMTNEVLVMRMEE